MAVVRERFRGKLTYCRHTVRGRRLDAFDFVSLELIRSAEVADQFRDGVRTLVAAGKTGRVTGFGTATWRGAATSAPRSMEILEYDEATGAADSD